MVRHPLQRLFSAFLNNVYTGIKTKIITKKHVRCYSGDLLRSFLRLYTTRELNSEGILADVVEDLKEFRHQIKQLQQQQEGELVVNEEEEKEGHAVDEVKNSVNVIKITIEFSVCLDNVQHFSPCVLLSLLKNKVKKLITLKRQL